MRPNLITHKSILIGISVPYFAIQIFCEKFLLVSQLSGKEPVQGVVSVWIRHFFITRREDMKNFRTLILSLLLVLSLAVAGCGLAPEPPCYHEWGEWGVATSATCTVDGLKTRICSKCEEVDSQVISSLGHDLQQYEAKAVTCTEIGWEAYETCSRCEDRKSTRLNSSHTL